MKQRKDLSWPMVLACAGTFFGVMVNAAFISGNLAYSYFAKFGWVGVLLPILSMALLTYTIWQAMNAGANRGCRSARQWADWISHPFDKIYGPIFDVVTLAGFCLSAASGIAAMGALLEEWFGFNYTVVCSVYAVVIVLIALTNAGIVSRFGGIVCVLLLASMLFVYPQVIAHHSDTLMYYVSNRVMFEDYTFGDALWRSLVWFGYQCMSIGSMMALRRDGGYSTRRDAKRIMIIGGLITTIFLVMTVLVVLSSLPECVSDVPILTAIEQINNPTLLTMYRVCMFLALVSTNGPGLYAMGGRWAMSFKKPTNDKLRMAMCCIVILLISFALSTFGLTAIVSKGWSYVGAIGVFVYGIPIFTVGVIKTRRDNKIPEEELTDEFKL